MLAVCSAPMITGPASEKFSSVFREIERKVNSEIIRSNEIEIRPCHEDSNQAFSKRWRQVVQIVIRFVDDERAHLRPGIKFIMDHAKRSTRVGKISG